MIEHAIEILQKTGFDFTARELAEIFWLAVYLDEGEQDSSEEKQQVKAEQDSSQEKQQLNPKQDSSQEKRQLNPKQDSFQEKQQLNPKQDSSQEKQQLNPKQDSSQKTQPQKVPIILPRQKGISIKVPAAPALRNTLELGRALRPLMRKVSSPTEKILDEEATVYRIAEQDVWVPVFQPKPQRWLELALVVEKSNSTAIWKPTIRELEQLLKYHGGFRDVRTWELKVTPKISELFPLKLSSQSSKIQNNARHNNSTSYSHDILIDPREQRLILLVSDCISTAWRDKFIHPTLKLWANKGLLTVLQLLPEQLWERTALSSEIPVQLSSLKPGVTNSQLLAKIWDEDDIDENSTAKESISIPIVTLEYQPLLTWSKVIAGFGNITTAGFKFSLDIDSKSTPKSVPELDASTSQTPPEVSADVLVNRFRATASVSARRLAGLMAAAPVSLAVVQLIQQTLLPNSRQIHAAEVFMSGLLKSTQFKNTQVDYIEYEFKPDIRELLLDSVPKSKTISVIDKVSEYIAQRLGLSVREFEALLFLPWSVDSSLANKIRPFAQIKAQVLRRLGGIYTYIAEDLENNFSTDTKASNISINLQDFVFNVPSISFKQTTEILPDINLQIFAFESATIELRKTGFFGRNAEVIVHRHPQQSQYFIEDLGNGIELQMVLIPGNTFTMGAPENEQGSDSSERPQHQVNVPTFFMARYQVSQAQWKAVANLPQVERELKPKPSHFKGDNLPVEEVSWYDAVEFCARLSNDTGREYRLPSEAEWEYACRAGTTTPFHFGETITVDLANYNTIITYANEPPVKYRRQTTPVGQFPPNGFGLHDMHGNVKEWCLDDLHYSYEGAPIDGSAWIKSENKNDNYSRKLLRGGSWYNDPVVCRSALRSYSDPNNVSYATGFRVVCRVAPKNIE